MRACWLVRENLTAHPGGDTTQILQTAAALRRQGVDVSLSSDPQQRFGGFDVVHLFHLDRLWEHEPHLRRLARCGVPAVLSPIYWPGDEFDRAARRGVQGWLARTFGSDAYRTLRLWQHWLLDCSAAGPRRWTFPPAGFRQSVHRLVRTVTVLLPNSEAERQLIERELRVMRPAVVVPNAVSDVFRPAAADWPGARDGVLCVGRIEPRKGQLALITALRGTGRRLVIIGQPGRYSNAYYQQCRREADERTVFVGPVPPEQLPPWYRRARVHVCPSWYETPGLVNLEAAICGCAIVATEGGCTREYLGDHACYCRPDDPSSIRQAVELAEARGPSPALAQHIARDLTWDAAGRKTREAYRLALEP